MGDHRLHPGLRRTPAAWRPDRRLRWPQADVHRRPDRVRRCIGPRGSGPGPGPAVRRTGPAGGLRRGDGPGGPVPVDHHLSVRPQGAGQGLRCLRGGVRRRGRHRCPARRDPDPVRLVALVPAGERPHRPPGRLLCLPCGPREPGVGEHQVRRARRPPVHGRAGQPGLRVHQGGFGRMELELHPDLPQRGGGPAGGIRSGRVTVEPSAPPPSGHLRAEPWRLVSGLAPDRGRPVRHVRLPQLLHAGGPRLLGPQDRGRLPALRHRAGRWPPAHRRQWCRSSGPGSR